MLKWIVTFAPGAWLAVWLTVVPSFLEGCTACQQSIVGRLHFWAHDHGVAIDAFDCSLDYEARRGRCEVLTEAGWQRLTCNCACEVTP